MGSCFSNTDDRKNKDQESSVSGKNRALPPSQFPVCEEESVKEVLSETPMLKSDENRVEKKTRFHNPVLGTVSEDEEQLQILKIRDGVHDATKPGYCFRSDKREDEVSDASEICSLTVSENVSTVTMNNGKRDSAEEEDEVMQRQKQRIKQRSPARTRHGVSDNNNNNNYYPARRSGHSPAKKTGGGGGVNGPARLVQPERDYSGGGARLTGMRSGSFRKDAGERSGRRSRSPATNRTVMATASVGNRRSNQSPGRVRLDPKERKMEQYGKRPNSGMNNHNNGGRELLENPLVSLECFIFL